jgi:hypothetical protein
MLSPGPALRLQKMPPKRGPLAQQAELPPAPYGVMREKERQQERQEELPQVQPAAFSGRGNQVRCIKILSTAACMKKGMQPLDGSRTVLQ